MKKLTFIRVIAYIMDSIFVFVLMSLLLKIEFINPNYDSYLEKTEEYMTLVEDYTTAVTKNASMITAPTKEMNDLSYEISKLSVFPTALGIIVALLYYVVCLYYNNGSTLAMSLLKMKVVDNSKEKAGFFQLMLRSVVIYGIIASMINVLLLMFASKADYITYGAYVNNASTLIIIACYVRMLFSRDGRGLHDLLAGTDVIKSNTRIKEANIVKEG